MEGELMRRLWLTMVGLALVIGMFTGVMIAQANQVNIKVDPGWRFNSGRWDYYDADDRAWYNTAGRNWYTYSDNDWRVYNFDRGFGKRSFYREGYVIPKPGPDVVVPRHKVYVPR